MGVFAGPDVSESGLVLALDAASPKNYNLTEVEYLIVAGGGSGGSYVGGGGGGGGVLQGSVSISQQSYTITVGDGGASAGSISVQQSIQGNNGGNSSAFGFTALGGGGGGRYAHIAGSSGGSGGGSGGFQNSSSSGGAGTSGQGNAGGGAIGPRPRGFTGGGGGGGAGTAGETSTDALNTGGNGGNGVISNILGVPYYFGGGGGGGNYADGSRPGNGGLGGGGGGSSNTANVSGVGGGSAINNTSGGNGSATGDPNNLGGNGAANSGGGGGGNGHYGLSGAGGSGIVIVRYPGPQKAIGGTVTSVGGYTIHTFTTVGSTTFTPLVATNNSVISGLSDFSGRGNFGTTANGPTYSSAYSGTIVFDGTDDRIDCGTWSASYLTVSTWVYKTSSATNQGICRKETGWAVSQYNGTLQVAPGTSWTFYDTGYTIPLNTWVNIVYTYSGTGAVGSQTVYVNGSSIYSTSVGSGPITANSNQVRIGYDDNNWFWGGRIANTQIYNRALTATEVQQNYNAIKSRFIQDGSSAERAAPSASHISSLGIRADGDYWYLPPGQTTPIQLYTVFSSAPAGKGYVLVARGRESTDWWNTNGQNTSALTSTSINTNTPIAVLSNSFVNSLINSQWNGMRFITNRINGGDSWLFVGTTSTTFSWTYFTQVPSTANATATKYNGLFLSSGVALNYSTGANWTDTLNYGGGNNCDRTFTWSWSGHGTYQGWSGGSTCTPAGAFQLGAEGHSIQLANCYVEC